MKNIYFFFIIFSLQAFGQEKDANFYAKAAEKDWIAGKLKSAYKNYYKAAELGKNYLYYIKSAEAYCFGHNNSKEKTRQTIESLYNKSFEIKPFNTEGLLSRAGYKRFDAEYESALNDLDTLIKRDSNCIDAYLLKASTLLEIRDTTNSFKTYDLAIKKAPQSRLSEIYLKLGGDCYVYNHWTRCIFGYTKALDLIGETNFKEFFYCNLTSAYSNIGDLSNSCKFYKRCDISKRSWLKNAKVIIKNCGQ
jgi:tetratricopeptide (TPR) repeat protein